MRRWAKPSRVLSALAVLGAFQGCNSSSFQLLSAANSGEGVFLALVVIGLVSLVGMFIRIAQR